MIPRRCFFCGSFLVFMPNVCLCYAIGPCDHLLGKADLLTLLRVVFSCVVIISHMVFRVK